MLVPGAMAATSAASAMTKPAEAPRAPAARRVHADDDEGRAGGVGEVDPLHHVGRADGVDDAVELDDRDVGAGRDGSAQSQGGRKCGDPPQGHGLTLGTRARGVNAGVVC
jgi:hypothetical protein